MGSYTINVTDKAMTINYSTKIMVPYTVYGVIIPAINIQSTIFLHKTLFTTVTSSAFQTVQL